MNRALFGDADGPPQFYFQAGKKPPGKIQRLRSLPSLQWCESSVIQLLSAATEAAASRRTLSCGDGASRFSPANLFFSRGCDFCGA
jgi:hypothetical protein